MKKYDELVSLGYNCEVSFRIQDVRKKLNPFLFSWLYVTRKELLYVLKNPFSIASGELYYLPNTNGMYLCNTTNISIYSRYHDTDLLDINGQFIQEKNDDAINEIKSRINHLAEKTERMFNSKNVFFVQKIKIDSANEINEVIEFIHQVYDILSLKCKKNWGLLIVLEDTYRIELYKSNLYIRYVKEFADDGHTDTAGDIEGWKTILSEFDRPMSKFEILIVRAKNFIKKLL